MKIFILSLLFLSACAHGGVTLMHKTLSVRFKPGQDLKVELQKFAVDNKLGAAAIVSAVGSLKKYNLRFANQKTSSSQEGHFEVVSLSGTLSAASMHVHMSVSDEKGKTVGGHLVDGNIIYTTMEIVIMEQPGILFSRELDPETGFNELIIK